jgi:hypothetical protein
MSKEQKPPEIPTELVEQLAKLIPPHLEEQAAKLAPPLAALTVTRSNEYRTIYSNFYRTRIGANEITMTFSRISHAPSILAPANIIEEQTEIVMGWPQLKMLAQTLREIVEAFEKEVGTIPLPLVFRPNLEGQRQAVRTLGLPSAERYVPDAQQGAPNEPAAPARSRTRRRSPTSK